VTFETLPRLNSIQIMSTFYVFFYFRSAISFALQYSHLFSKNLFRHHWLLRVDRWCRWWLQSYPKLSTRVRVRVRDICLFDLNTCHSVVVIYWNKVFNLGPPFPGLPKFVLLPLTQLTVSKIDFINSGPHRNLEHVCRLSELSIAASRWIGWVARHDS